MSKFISVLVGGYTSEYDISIQSGLNVAKSIMELGHTCFIIYIGKKSWHYKNEEGKNIEIDKQDFSLTLGAGKRINFDLVVNMIHGSPGEDGVIISYFNLQNIPILGSQAYESGLTMNKFHTICVLKNLGIKCAESLILKKNEKIDLKKIVNKVGLPCFVKPNQAGSSYGISKVMEKKDLQFAIEKAFKEDDSIIIEQYIEGREFSIGVVEFKTKTIALPITEIIPSGEFFDYAAKYEGKSDEITPAPIGSKLEKELKKLAITIFEILSLRSFSRAEFIVTENEEIVFLETNTIPGFTDPSILPQQLKVGGISLSSFFEDLIKNI